ncbi:hypothetical protein SERLA73DRAFT_154309 [Serpula lacrymans var. lacrymans S7.3]|uniref:Uncharacterized protein n=1 Tax=Serpula lacrymans var. lacrymans (strain S7.3) TaxID=936435 RepID=F8Q457_SERL3|nr:hypothetical protein SERLA73DRAFT_154309 [Serpula lacrymans var. lacrymans S7.3]
MDTLLDICRPSKTSLKAQYWALQVTTSNCAAKICSFSMKESGWHFNAAKATANQIKDFYVQDMSSRFEKLAPLLWKQVGDLLLLSSSLLPHRLSSWIGDSDITMAGVDAEEEEEYWEQVDGVDLEGMVQITISDPIVCAQKAKKCHRLILTVKKVVIISVLMHSTNQKVNSLQNILGIFLQFSHALKRVIDTLAHMGIL